MTTPTKPSRLLREEDVLRLIRDRFTDGRHDLECAIASLPCVPVSEELEECARMCEAAGHDERLADGGLYLRAARLLRAPQQQAEPVAHPLSDRLRNLASEIEPNDSHEEIDPDAALLNEAADALEYASPPPATPDSEAEGLLREVEPYLSPKVLHRVSDMLSIQERIRAYLEKHK